ncbi:MAG: hypothetical protein QXU54_02630, partial [Candidatus Micrarchaeia archaeon]
MQHTVPTNRVDLAKEFRAGKITVNQFMAELTREGTATGDTYKILLDGVKAGHIKEIWLVKNDDGTYGFKGVLTKEGEKAKEIHTMSENKKKLAGRITYLTRSSQAELLDKYETEFGGIKSEKYEWLDSAITISDSWWERLGALKYAVTETGYKEFTLEERRMLFKGEKYTGDETLGKKS